MSETKKTSTFTVDHDRCRPSEWVARDILAFADFVRSGDMRYAAALARLGVQLVLSELHEPKGGALQEIGWAVDDDGKFEVPISDDLEEITDGEDITAVVRMYRGQTEYAVRYLIGDGDGGVDGAEYVFAPTKEEAERTLKEIEDEALDAWKENRSKTPESST